MPNKRCNHCGRKHKKHKKKLPAFLGIDGKRYTIRKGKVVRA